MAPEVASDPVAASAPSRESATTLFSYGDIGYSRPRGDASDTQADLVRAVIGFGHRFDEKTRVYVEFEWEHAIASADDKGEAEVEHLLVERKPTDQFGARVARGIRRNDCARQINRKAAEQPSAR